MFEYKAEQEVGWHDDGARWTEMVVVVVVVISEDEQDRRIQMRILCVFTVVEQKKTQKTRNFVCEGAPSRRNT